MVQVNDGLAHERSGLVPFFKQILTRKLVPRPGYRISIAEGRLGKNYRLNIRLAREPIAYTQCLRQIFLLFFKKLFQKSIFSTIWTKIGLLTECLQPLALMNSAWFRLGFDAFCQYLWDLGYFHEQNKQVVLVTLCLIFYMSSMKSCKVQNASMCKIATVLKKLLKGQRNWASFFAQSFEKDVSSRQFWLWGSFGCLEIMMTTASIMWYLKARN